MTARFYSKEIVTTLRGLHQDLPRAAGDEARVSLNARQRRQWEAPRC